MKSAVALVALFAGALAAPAALKRDDAETETDTLLFDTTLPDFETARNNKDPSDLDWTSDGCTDSPDNPLGFNYLPACHRHDFGYQNYRAQSRFTTSAKLKIDNNFLSDLKYQCSSTSEVDICDALAEVYYAAVRAFGGQDATPGKRSEELVKIYEEKVKIYEKLVKEAQDAGRIPKVL